MNEHKIRKSSFQKQTNSCSFDCSRRSSNENVVFIMISALFHRTFIILDTLILHHACIAPISPSIVARRHPQGRIQQLIFGHISYDTLFILSIVKSDGGASGILHQHNTSTRIFQHIHTLSPIDQCSASSVRANIFILITKNAQSLSSPLPSAIWPCTILYF